MTKVTIVLILMMFVVRALADDAKASAPAETNKQQDAGKDGDKLDLKQLEDKYWSAKDTDFSVIQNRTFSKDHRWFISAEYGTLINDPYSTAKIYTLSTGYYFNEHWGIQLARDTQNNTDNSATSNFASQFGAKPNYNIGLDYNSLNVLWVPMYAKMSVMDKAIWYFDLQFGAGLGLIDYQSQVQPGQGSSLNQSTVGVNLDVTTHIFFSRNWAVRVDFKNVWSNEDLQRYNIGANASRDLGSSSQWDTRAMIGLTYFFGQGVNPNSAGH